MRRRKIKRRALRQQKPQARAAFPDPAAWQEIVEMRQEILSKSIELFMSRRVDAYQQLVDQYGVYHVDYVLDISFGMSERELILEYAMLYREYRRLYAQFGAGWPFLSRAAYFGDPAVDETASGVPDKVRPADRLRHLRYATDITPPAIPTRPDDFQVPLSRTYRELLRPILRLGWKLDKASIAPHLARSSKWKKMHSELVQMAIDPGLVNGWPGEPESWAPYHALSLLALWPAAEIAGELLPLLEVENDWLSDRLPDLWAKLGPDSALPLWDIMEQMDRDDAYLGVILMGLFKIAQAHPAQREATIERLTAILSDSPASRADLNAYLILILDEMRAETAIPTIQTAFAEKRVNTRIMDKDSVNLLYPDEAW